MVSADGTIRHQAKTLSLAEFIESERPVSIQLFGGDPVIMAEAVRIISEKRPDFIDLNFGCPAKKIVKRGAGSALLRDLPRLQAIARAAVNATAIPVTAKVRSGWDHHSIVAVEAAERLQDSGIAAITLHPRTQTMGFKGTADIALIKKVKNTVHVPVIGNGDIMTAQDAELMFKKTGCDMVMIGRAALGNPWIFPQIQAYIKNAISPLQPSFSERIDVCLEHLGLAVQWYGTNRAVFKMRKQISMYIKGLPNNSEIRRAIFSKTNVQDIQQVLHAYKEQLNQMTTKEFVRTESMN